MPTAKKKSTAKARPKASTRVSALTKQVKASRGKTVLKRTAKKHTVDKDRFMVRLKTMGDYPHNDTLMAEVSGRGSDTWADSDGYIGGSSWETPRDMPGFAYAMPGNYPGLVSDLRKEGYKLNLSEYEEVEPSCKKCGCTDRDCGWNPRNQ